MSKTIQVRVDDGLKDSADLLFSSLGLDTSTAIRMFLIASMESGGIPFPIQHNTNRDLAVLDSVNYRKQGGEFLTAKQSLANARAALESGFNHGK